MGVRQRWAGLLTNKPNSDPVRIPYDADMGLKAKPAHSKHTKTGPSRQDAQGYRLCARRRLSGRPDPHPDMLSVRPYCVGLFPRLGAPLSRLSASGAGRQREEEW